MKRKSFLKKSIMTSLAGSLLPFAGIASKNPDEITKSARDFYELRIYTLKNSSQQKLVEDYFSNAAIPALNRLGIERIGVFTELNPTGNTKLFVIIPYKSLDEISTIDEKLSKDKTYSREGGAYLEAPATEPAYDRIESSLLKAFEGMPKLEIPGKKPSIFELRRYESASEHAGKMKIDMFNSLGEISIFKRVGLTPVFFGETIIGSARPNLTYMLTYDDMAEHDKNWKVFINDPEWKKISAMPDYSNAKIVSKITSIFLTPAAYSQL